MNINPVVAQLMEVGAISQDTKDHLIIKYGVRDHPTVIVRKCTKTGVLFLDTDARYPPGNIESYDIRGTPEEDAQREDVLRRYAAIQSHHGFNNPVKNVLDVGSGAGGLSHLFNQTKSDVCAVEPDESCWIVDGVKYTKSLNEVGGKFNIIGMFHVLEHMDNPIKELQTVHNLMHKKSRLFLEVPNAGDFMISSNGSHHYRDFIFWTEHLVVHDEHSLRKLLDYTGFEILHVDYIQRYPYTNHLYWFSHGKPNGHKKLEPLYDKHLNKSYERWLHDNKMTDTIYIEAKVK
jgi:2-polyprenyl-3-methyl-5-hydroxy-6-metoxy-1,4-benzoquinol methylase